MITFFSFACVFFLCIIQNTFAQVQVYLQQPPPNQFKLEHMWRVTITNPTNTTYKINLYGRATEASAGFIVDAVTDFFLLPPGTKKVTGADISPITLQNTNKKYEDIVKNTGDVPSGNYEICVSVINTDNGETLGLDCIGQEVLNFTQAELISPENKALANDEFPVFVWLPPSPVLPGQNVTYKLQIAEIYLKQTPYDAIQSNPEFFQKDNICSSVFQYPNASRTFQTGRRYAWKVYAYHDRVLISETEVREFIYEHQRDWVITIGSGTVFGKSGRHPHTGGEEVKQSSGNLTFSGSSKIEGLSANRQGTDQTTPQRYANWELTPALSIYKIPFSWNILLSTQGKDIKQNINSLSLLLDPQKLTEKVDQRAEEELKRQRELIEKKIANEVNELKKEKLRIKYEESARQEGRKKISGGLKFFSYFKTFGVGVTYPNYSSNTLSGVPVTGTDIEFNPGLFYFAASGLRNQRPVDNISYKRNLFSGRLGVGRKEKSHFFLTALYVKDDENSIIVTDSNSTLTPQSNYLFGAEGKLSLFKERLIIEAEGVGSMLTRDVRSADISNKSIPDWLKKIIHPKISSSADYTYSFKSSYNNEKSLTKISAAFKMVGPGFTSLGVPNLAKDKLAFEGKIEQKLADKKISLSAFFKRDRDNLADWKTYTTFVTAFGINFGLNFRKYPFLRISYSPFFQRNNTDADSFKVDNRTSVLSVLAGYNFKMGRAYLSSSVSYSLQGINSPVRIAGVSDYLTQNMYITESLTFGIPLTFTGNLGLIFSKFTSQPDCGTGVQTEYGRIISFDFSGSYLFFEVIHTTAGGNLNEEREKNSKKSFYAGVSVNAGKYLILDIRAEQNIYEDRITSANDYKEFILRSTLSANW